MTRFARTIVDNAPAVLVITVMLMIGASVAALTGHPVMATVDGVLAVVTLGLLARTLRRGRAL